MENGFDLPRGVLVPGQMRGNEGRWVWAGNMSSLIPGADQREPPPHPIVCEQIRKSHPPELRKELPRESVAGP